MMRKLFFAILFFCFCLGFVHAQNCGDVNYINLEDFGVIFQNAPDTVIESFYGNGDFSKCYLKDCRGAMYYFEYDDSVLVKEGNYINSPDTFKSCRYVTDFSNPDGGVFAVVDPYFQPLKDGVWKYYDSTGAVIKQETWNSGILQGKGAEENEIRKQDSIEKTYSIYFRNGNCKLPFYFDYSLDDSLNGFSKIYIVPDTTVKEIHKGNYFLFCFRNCNGEMNFRKFRDSILLMEGNCSNSLDTLKRLLIVEDSKNPGHYKMSTQKYFQPVNDGIWKYYDDHGKYLRRELWDHGHSKGIVVEAKDTMPQSARKTITTYYPSGAKESEYDYWDGNVGAYKEWYENGKLKLVGQYEEADEKTWFRHVNKKTGEWISYDEKGRKTETDWYKDGYFTHSEEYNKHGKIIGEMASKRWDGD
jgi:antitoxin component YwqK of YwqJK toxin-antitoxin module